MVKMVEIVESVEVVEMVKMVEIRLSRNMIFFGPKFLLEKCLLTYGGLE